MEHELVTRLRERMEAAGFSMKSLSVAAGLNETYVRDVLAGRSRPTVTNLIKLAEALHTSIADLIGEGDPTTKVVPVMGYVGAGAEVEPEFEQVPPEGLDHVTLPFAVPGDLIAFKVRGTSMLPVYREDAVVLVYREQRRAIESFYGEEAAVRTADGRRFIKTITRGGRVGTVTLTSWNANPIEDQRLEWVGEIFAILPPSGARRVEKQGGIQWQLRFSRS
jgi:transcriptional regulator with XRE-family HTH domain